MRWPGFGDSPTPSRIGRHKRRHRGPLHWTKSTVEDVATFFDRSPVTIRTWIREERLFAYHFRGNEYRITNAALEEFQDQERNREQSRT